MRTLADIIIDKLRERSDVTADAAFESPTIPPKVIHVYSSVGKLLQHYKSGKLPKALKMLPHLKNWEVHFICNSDVDTMF
jgi:essential nuclear protein 1